MRLNNMIFSLLNKNNNLALNNQLLVKSYKDSKVYTRSDLSDKISIDTAKKYTVNQKMLSSVKSVDGQPITELTAVNNTLTIDKGSYYRFQTKEGRTVILTSDNQGSVYMPYDELNLADDAFTPSQYGEIERVEKFFTYLGSDMSGYCVRINYSKAETKEMLARAGIEPGWFEVKSGPKTNKFYMLDDGTIFPEYQVKAELGAFNTRNWFNDGYTKDSIFIIDGKEYKLDDNGHVHIPEGTGCVMKNVKMIK